MANLRRGAIDIAEGIRKAEGMEKRSVSQPPEHTFKFTGTGSKTTFALQKGWKALGVKDAGLDQTEGSGDDWTQDRDGYIWTVTFSVAPTNLNDILIKAWRAK
jgi:hypothetical protein